MAHHIKRLDAHGRRWLGVVAVVAVVGMGLASAVALGRTAPTPVSKPEPKPGPKPASEPISETTSYSTPLELKSSVAAADPKALVSEGDASTIAQAIQSSTEWERIGQIAGLLTSAEHRSLLDSDAVVGALAGRLTKAPAKPRGSILEALSLLSSPKAVRGVMRLLGPGVAYDVSAEAMRTLVKQTGRWELGNDIQAWRQWWTQQEWIPESQWRLRVARWQAAYARTLANKLDTSDQRQVDLIRELYAVTGAEDRPALLIRMLGDSLAPIRQLGLELASRAIVNATKIPLGVLEAAGALLRDPSASVRIAAATLLASAGLNGEAGAVSLALAQERSPQAAGAMLDALVYSDPTTSDEESATRWIADPTAGQAAASLLLAALDHGGLTTPTLRNRAYEAVRPGAGVPLGAAGVRLFGRLASSQELDRLGDLLDDPESAIRDAAAQSLAQRPDGLERLLEATRADASLLRFAVVGLSQHRADREGWAWLSSAPGVTKEMLTEFAVRMPPREALAAALAESAPETRLTLLTRFEPTSPETTSSENDVTQANIMGAGRVARLRTLLDLDQFDTVIEEAATASGKMDEGKRRSALAVALLCSNRIEDASNANATAQDWLDAIARVEKLDKSRAIALAQAGVETYSSVFTADQLGRLKSLKTRLAAIETSASGNSESPAPVDPEPATPPDAHRSDSESRGARASSRRKNGPFRNMHYYKGDAPEREKPQETRSPFSSSRNNHDFSV